MYWALTITCFGVLIFRGYGKSGCLRPLDGTVKGQGLVYCVEACVVEYLMQAVQDTV